MRRVALLALIVIQIVCHTTCMGQVNPNLPDYTRPKLFQQLPDTLQCRNEALRDLLVLPEGAVINTVIAPGFNFQGMVTASVQKPGRKTVLLKSSNYPGATLSFSEVVEENGASVWRGRIISFGHLDAFEISFHDGRYYFIKKDFYRLVNE